MVTCQLDYLTLSCMTSKDISVGELLGRALETLRLNDIWDKFVLVGRDKFYESVFRYNDISVLVCRDTPEKLLTQGICIKFSGNGLSFFQEHLHDTWRCDLQRICREWRCLSVGGYFTRCSRFDYAIDDICRGEQKPILTMRKVRNAAKKREFRSRLSVNRPRHDIQVCFDSSVKDGILIGDTVYFGNRKSSVFCRFYDKRLEQLHSHLNVDEDITSWCRCEFEFKHSRSMSAFNAFCDMNVDDFKGYISKVFNNYISFINKDDVNRSRCSVKRWWTEFLGTAEKASLIIPPYKPVTFSSTSQWLQKSVFPTLAYYVKCIGYPAFLRILKKYINRHPTKRIKQMVDDYVTVFMYSLRHSDTQSTEYIAPKEAYDLYLRRLGLDPWIMTGSESAEELEKDFEKYHVKIGAEWEPFGDCDYGVQLSYNYDDYPPEFLTSDYEDDLNILDF